MSGLPFTSATAVLSSVVLPRAYTPRHAGARDGPCALPAVPAGPAERFTAGNTTGAGTLGSTTRPSSATRSRTTGRRRRHEGGLATTRYPSGIATDRS